MAVIVVHCNSSTFRLKYLLLILVHITVISRICYFQVVLLEEHAPTTVVALSNFLSLTSDVCQVNFSSGSAPFNCFAAILRHSSFSGTLYCRL